MNVKIFSTVSAIVLLSFSSAFATEIPLGCISKEKLQTVLKENHQSFLEQFQRSTPKGEIKTSVTSEYNGDRYVHGGRGYLIESRGTEGCIIAKTRLDVGPTSSDLTISTVHKFGDTVMTSEEWRKTSKFAQTNRPELEAQWVKEGYSKEKIADAIKVLEIMAKHGGVPDDISAELKYKLENGKPISVSRTQF